jgi:O-antigen/teichoic acid export membrane protein
VTVDADATVEQSLGDFGGFLRSAGKLAVGRQVSALCLVAMVFVLPTMTTRVIATDFIWAYFAMLTLTSLLGIGLERLAGAVAAGRGDMPLSRALAPVLFLRLMSLPAVAVGLWLLLRFVGVSLSSAAWTATFVWILAGLVSPILFGGLRAAGNSLVEPAVMIGVRAVQAAVLAAVAIAGAPVAVLVTSVALVEWAGVIAAVAAIGHPRATWGAWTHWRALPMRQAFALAGIEAVGVMNLRADLLLVGHILGAAPGATYGLLYRSVDAFNSVVGSAGVWLYAESANERDGGTDPRGLRARSLAVLPRFGLAVATAVVLGAGVLASAVPRLSAQADTLRILAIAFPILSLNVVELHVRSGRGRNREVLLINAITLAVNVPLCIGAIAAFGLPGAAAALAATELLQAGMLWCSASADERALIAPAMVTAILGALVLAWMTVALGVGLVVVAVVALAVLVLLIARTVRISSWSALRP